MEACVENYHDCDVDLLILRSTKFAEGCPGRYQKHWPAWKESCMRTQDSASTQTWRTFAASMASTNKNHMKDFRSDHLWSWIRCPRQFWKLSFQIYNGSLWWIIYCLLVSHSSTCSLMGSLPTLKMGFWPFEEWGCRLTWLIWRSNNKKWSLLLTAKLSLEME